MSMEDNRVHPEELPCPFWQKKCSEVNAGKPGCNMLVQAMGMPPGALTPKPMLLCKIDIILGQVQGMSMALQQRQQLPKGLLPPFGKG